MEQDSKEPNGDFNSDLALSIHLIRIENESFSLVQHI